MIKLFNSSILALALVATISMAMVQTAGASVPFKGRGNGEIIVQQPIGNLVMITATGIGQSTHLGRFTRIENLLLDPNTGTFTGDVTFTAANGDHLTADITGGFTSQTTAAGTYTFTGGTGRFADATGSADFAVALTDPTHFTFEFGGSIHY